MLRPKLNFVFSIRNVPSEQIEHAFAFRQSERKRLLRGLARFILAMIGQIFWDWVQTKSMIQSETPISDCRWLEKLDIIHGNGIWGYSFDSWISEWPFTFLFSSSFFWIFVCYPFLTVRCEIKSIVWIDLSNVLQSIVDYFTCRFIYLSSVLQA